MDHLQLEAQVIKNETEIIREDSETGAKTMKERE